MPNPKTSKRTTLPPGEVQLTNWGPLRLLGPLRALVLPDIHMPYHSLNELLISIDAGKRFNATHVVVNGDAFDFYELSKFCKDPRARKFREEVKMAGQLFAFLREQFPRSEIIYKLGNHEERYETYMMRNAPELLGVDDFNLENILRLKDFGIVLVKDKRVIRLGDLNLIHGHEYRFAISNPVNPARGLFLKGKSYAMCSHFHQASYHSENTLEGKTVSTWSTSCLCDLHPAYMPHNNWSNGFALVDVAKDNKFNVHNRVIRNGIVY